MIIIDVNEVSRHCACPLISPGTSREGNAALSSAAVDAVASPIAYNGIDVQSTENGANHPRLW